MEYRPLGRTGVQVSLTRSASSTPRWMPMEQLESQLPAADVVLDEATLDRIDEIVRPGTNLNPADTSYGERVLQPARRRR